MNTGLPVYIPRAAVCHMTSYHCCTHRTSCRLYPVCSQITMPEVCKKDCPSCDYTGCSLSPDKRKSEPVYVGHVIQADRSFLDLEGAFHREQAEHRRQHQKQYEFYNRLFGDLTQRKREQHYRRYWADPERYRQYQRDSYRRLHPLPEAKPIPPEYMPECQLQCAQCPHPDCILPEDWRKKAVQRVWTEKNPTYFADYREAHREERRQKSNKYYAEHREERRQYQRAHRQKPEVKAQRRETERKYREEHPERLEYERRYREEHREELRQKSKKYNAEHREERRQKENKYDAEHRQQRQDYYQAHKAEISAKHRAYYQAHKAEISAKHREAWKQRSQEASAP